MSLLLPSKLLPTRGMEYPFAKVQNSKVIFSTLLGDLRTSDTPTMASWKLSSEWRSRWCSSRFSFGYPAWYYTSESNMLHSNVWLLPSLRLKDEEMTNTVLRKSRRAWCHIPNSMLTYFYVFVSESSATVIACA
jgi:hypothetical protein